ncbi:hypothetical protein NE237_004526 [Protea cynaroides]|uniref:Uncharacterized protein n=1 Tax=Protea cynaroides TaxID=273540 RepID=A0A9Q0QTP4_9MAGN|nr:hypothetical protein NE237_004526 [Protea cynaroides]
MDDAMLEDSSLAAEFSFKFILQRDVQVMRDLSDDIFMEQIHVYGVEWRPMHSKVVEVEKERSSKAEALEKVEAQWLKEVIDATRQIKAQKAPTWASPTLSLLAKGVPAASSQDHPKAHEDIPPPKAVPHEILEEVPPKETSGFVAERVVRLSSKNTQAMTSLPIVEVSSLNTEEGHPLMLSNKDTPTPALIETELGVEDYVIQNKEDILSHPNSGLTRLV